MGIMPSTAINLATALITQFEGFEEGPYQDPTGTWTIGYGFTGPWVNRATPAMSKEQAITYLSNLLEGIDQRLNGMCFEPLTDHQRAACLSLSYNIGLGSFSQSTLLKYLNDGAYGAASSQFGLYTWSRGVQLAGLVKRREAEKECFNTAD